MEAVYQLKSDSFLRKKRIKKEAQQLFYIICNWLFCLLLAQSKQILMVAQVVKLQFPRDLHFGMRNELAQVFLSLSFPID